MKRPVIVALAASTVIAGVTAWLLFSPRPGAEALVPPPTTPAFPVAPAAVAPSSAQAPCRFIAGHRLAYDVSSTTSLSLTEALSKFSAGQSAQLGQATARLELEVTEVETSSAVLLARLTQRTGAFAAEGNVAPDTFLLRVNERCEVAGFARRANTTKKEGRPLQALAHELWFTLPDGPAPVGVAFDTSTGRASGLVYGAGGASPRDLVRTIQRYERAWSPSMNGVVVERSRAEVQRGAGVWFDALEGVEEFSVPGVVTRGSAALKVTSAAPAPAALEGVSRDQADYVWESCFGEVPDQRLRPFVAGDYQRRVEAMRDVSYPDALDRMLGTFDVATDIHHQSRDMSAFLDAHPEAIPEFAGAVLTEFLPEWKAAGFLALANTQNAAAREVLLDVWRERDAPSMDRVRASLGLASRKDVGAPLARELLAEARRPGTPAQRDVSRQALLHVGVLGGMQPEDEELRVTVHTGLASELSSRQDALERSAVYAAIGNTGDLSFLPELDRASRNPDPQFRAVVPIALRRMPVEAVHDFTLDWLRRETSPEVMRELFEVIQHQYQDLGRPVGRELATEAVQYLRRQPRLLTRQSILQILKPFAADDEAIRAAFRDQLKIEYETNTGLFGFIASCLPDEDVRAVLATIPSLADQHRGADHAPLPVTPPPPPELSPLPGMLPKLPPEIAEGAR